MNPATLSRMSTGTAGLLLAYTLVALPFAAALWFTRPRLAVAKLLAAPLLAIPLTLAIAVLWSLTRSAYLRWDHQVDITSLSVIGLGFYGAMGYLAGAALRRAGPALPHHIERGTVILDADSGPRPRGRFMRLFSRHPRCLTLAGFEIPEADEPKHFKFIGTTGTGKSTAIRELIGAALERGDAVLFADPDGGYRDRYYDASRGDCILNPFDPRAHRWDLFAELRDPYDVEQLARALIPDGGGADNEWRGYARVFFAAIVRALQDLEVDDVGELFRLVAVAPREDLKPLVRGSPAQPFLEDANARMFGSIRSVASTHLAALQFIGDQQNGEPLSVRQWIRSLGTRTGAKGAGGALFLPYEANQIASLRGLISAWMRLAIFEMMLHPPEARGRERERENGKKNMSAARPGGSAPQDTRAKERDDETFVARTGANGPHGSQDGQRCWFVVDELDALGAIDGLKDALARLRKFGGRCVLGFQSIAQVSGTYGDAEAQTIVENCANTLILRCSASESGGTARFASRLIGEREVLRTQVSISRRGGFFSEPTRTRSWSEHRSTESAVLASEIEQLPDLTGYLKLAGRAEWQQVRLPIDPKRH